MNGSTGEARAATARDFAELDNVELRTVGIDVGSSTSHVTFSEVHMQRLGDRLSTRYVPVRRRVLHQSEIILTPYLPDYTIDAATLGRFVDSAFQAAGYEPHQVDSGAVILTGEATKRRNAAAIAEHLAKAAGEFVCATAGHHLESAIAAHGSGAVAASHHLDGLVLNVDIGGGTTKFAVIEDGIIVRTAAVEVGGRLIALDDGVVTRLEPAGSSLAQRIGLAPRLGATLSDADLRRLAHSMADLVLGCISGTPIDASLWLTDPLDLAWIPSSLSFSGGVAEYIYRRESRAYGDLGPELGGAIRAGLEAAGLWQRVLEPREMIRATVIGAAQYTVQVTGSTVWVSDRTSLPMRNVKVVPASALPEDGVDAMDLARQLRRALERGGMTEAEPVAFAFRWSGRPFHARLKAVAQALTDVASAAHDRPLVVIFDSDVAHSIGAVLRDELDWPGPAICLDGITVGEFDFVDIGRRIEPSGTYPVVVKSLVFAGEGASPATSTSRSVAPITTAAPDARRMPQVTPLPDNQRGGEP